MKLNHPQLKAMAACLALSLSLASEASDREREGQALWPRSYVQECASCHVAYPPGMLPAASWRGLMQGLDRHFGTDASLDPAELERLSQWLQATAGESRRVSSPPPENRITRSSWFERKHRQIEAATWRLPSVRSAANCAACHTGAERGQYSEHGLRMPAGLSASQRARWDD